MSRPRTLLAWALLAATVQAVTAGAHYGAVALAERSGWPVFRAAERGLIFADVPAYYRHASNAAQGLVPYRDDPIEYPLLALPFLFLPRAIASSQRDFVLLFAAEMLLVNAALVVLVARWIGQAEGLDRVPRRLAWYTVCVATLSPLLLGRYDIVPAAFGFAAACCWFGGRPAVGGLAAGLGMLVKIAPGAVAVPGLLWEWNQRRSACGRGAAAFALSLAAGIALWVALGGRGVLDSIRYHAERGVELGSVGSGLLFLAAYVTGAPVATSYDHSATHLITPWSAGVARLALPIQLAALGLVGWRAWRSGFCEPLRWAGAAVLAFAIVGKVLSPQYLLWVLPFVATLRGPIGRRARVLFLAAALATAAIYPWGFGAFERLELGMFLVLNLRNTLLLGLLVLLLFDPELIAESARVR